MMVPGQGRSNRDLDSSLQPSRREHIVDSAYRYRWNSSLQPAAAPGQRDGPAPPGSLANFGDGVKVWNDLGTQHSQGDVLVKAPFDAPRGGYLSHTEDTSGIPQYF